MSSLPVCRAALSTPFLKFLDEHGRDPSAMMKQLRIDKQMLANPALYLPSHLIALLIESVATATYHSDIGFYAAQYMDAGMLHPDLQRQLIEANDLTSLLDTLISLRHLQGSHFQIWLEHEGNELRICHSSALAISNRSYGHANEFTSFFIINQLKRLLGSNWQPTYLAFHHKCQPKAKIVGQTEAKKVIYGARKSYVPVSVEIGQLSRIKHYRNEVRNGALTRVTGVIDTFWEHEDFNIEFVAHLFGVSERTLQRVFLNNDTTFRDYMNKKKINKSIKLLEQGYSVQRVAELMQYSDSSNFSRAMKKYINVTPSKYVQQLERGILIKGPY